jgi:DNA polymerase-3 subunit gamma/tau
MLSKNAFNALLKTLEEPPAHVKFLFATTEVNKVPVTVLSRCQRFDLRRIPAERLAAHFAEVAAKEEVEVEPEALALIARAAEGSARDGLSILDQAIAHGAGGVTAGQVRAMLGLSDRGAIRELLRRLLAGDAPGALAALQGQYDLGVEPAAVIRGLLENVHAVTRAKVGGAAQDPAQSAEEREAYAEWTGGLSYAAIHRLWQLLLKGLGEVHGAPIPLEAAEMALLRVIHAAELPDPGMLAEKLAGGESLAARTPSASPAPEQGALMGDPPTFGALIQALEAHGRQHLGQQLHDYARLVSYEPPELVICPTGPIGTRDLATALREMTGRAWRIETRDSSGDPTLREQEIAAKKALEQSVLDMPLVKAAFEAFPDAQLEHYSLDERSA